MGRKNNGEQSKGKYPPHAHPFYGLPRTPSPRTKQVRETRRQQPLQILFTFLSTFASSARMAASPAMAGPCVVVPSMRTALEAPVELPPAVPFAPVAPVLPEPEPLEFAVPKLLVPGAFGDLAELPAPLGSLPALFSPPALPGPFGMPLAPAGPAPAAPAAGDPVADPVPLEAPEAEPPAAPPADEPPAEPPLDPPPPPPPL